MNTFDKKLHYKIFGKHTGLRVSEFSLGTGMFGTQWGHGAEPEEARRIFDAYAEAGGNFIDTADGYQFGQSEVRGWTPVAGLQIEYSLVERTPDRELLPMADAFGLGTVAWSPLRGGLLTGKYREGQKGRATDMKRVAHCEDTAQETAVLDEVLAVAKQANATPSQVAIAWVRAKGLITIIGPRTRAPD